MKVPSQQSRREARQALKNELTHLRWLEKDEPTLGTLAESLWAMVRTYSGNPLLVSFLADLIDIYGVETRDPVGLAKAIADYSVRDIKFFREFPERLQSPMRTVAWGIGDCDDKAIFVAASLRSFRIPVRAVFLKLKHPEIQLSHVYPQAFISGQWVSIDTVRRYPWGHNPADVARSRGILIDESYVGDSEPTDTSYA